MPRIATIPDTASRSWNGSLARALAPRRFTGAPDAPGFGVAGWLLRVLPTRTRPSLFGSD
jgi:hypothetical protein